MRRKHSRSLQDQLLRTKLEMEQVKLEKLRGVHSVDGSRVETFLHYEDLPAPPPEDQERFYVRLESQMEALEEAEEKGRPMETYDVNPKTHNPHTGEPYDYSDVEAQYGPYDRPDKPPITVTLRPSTKDMP